jgi:hypothetical protein
VPRVEDSDWDTHPRAYGPVVVAVAQSLSRDRTRSNPHV